MAWLSFWHGGDEELLTRCGLLVRPLVGGCVACGVQALATGQVPWSELRLALELVFEGVDGCGAWQVNAHRPAKRTKAAAAGDGAATAAQEEEEEGGEEEVYEDAVSVGDLVNVTFKPANPR